MMKFFFKNKQALIIISLLSGLFLLRICLFVNTYGGVEHDSGWYLGVAKNVAERGIYASFTNTIGEDKVGANPTIHGRFGVQDADGYMYFPAGVTVGPGYVFPEALILKIFGNGWWQYRAWPLLAFTFLLFISFYIVKRIGGYVALIIFAVWLWVIPQYYIGYSFEAFSESIAMMFFLLGGWILFRPVSQSKKYYFLAGLLFACSYLTKNLFLLPISSLGIFVLYDLVKNRNQIRKALFKWIVLFFGIILPIILFQVYQYISLMIMFGRPGVDAVKEDYRLHFLLNGSGIENFTNLDLEFIRKKINIWIVVLFKSGDKNNVLTLSEKLITKTISIVKKYCLFFKEFSKRIPIKTAISIIPIKIACHA